MKIIIICGLSGSGKTTSITGLARYLAQRGKKTAVILTEKGEAGIGDEIISDTGILVKEVISDCVPCSLRFNLESALKNTTEESNPDVVIIELLSSASPVQIKESLEPMDIPDLSFAPIVNMVDASNFRTEIDKLPKFVITQIEEADILCLNKVDIADSDQLMSVKALLKSINSDAKTLEFSARLSDEGFKQFVSALVNA